MPRVRELTTPYESFLLSPRPGDGVCTTCFNFTDGYQRCYACTRNETWLDAVAPISYSPAREQLHHVLASYKRVTGEVARRLAAELAAVLWRFLSRHEGCIAQTAGVRSFPLVTTVPSGEPERDEGHPLRRIVAQLVVPTHERHERLLRRAPVRLDRRAFSASRYEPVRELDGQAVLLIDDTWTTGTSAQSAAAALKAAGAGPVGAVVIGRHVNRDWHETDRRLRALGQPFGWELCALCAVRAPPTLTSDSAARSRDQSCARTAPAGYRRLWMFT